MDIRAYDEERDLDALMQIHRDVGWSGETDAHRRAGRLMYDDGTTLVGLVDGRARSFASNHDGVMRYLDDELPLCVVGGVATSHTARRSGLATRLTAEAVARDAVEKSAAVALLGVFDHGFYDKLGFGPGAYDHFVSFDPAALRVPVPGRSPVRLGIEDAGRMHANRAARPLRHGGIRLTDKGQTHADMLVMQDTIGLGFEDGNGALTHHVFLRTLDRGGGPWIVKWLAYREPAQLLELFGLLRGASDQVRTVKLIEPADIRVWDLLDRPWRRQNLTRGSKDEAFVKAASWWAARICDLPACLAAARLAVAEPLRFNLVLDDPISGHLSAETAARWAGVGGEHVVTLGPESAAEPGSDAALPTMRASVGTFTRLWLGVHDARGLALTCPDLEAPPELLRAIDRVLRLPNPELGWDI